MTKWQKSGEGSLSGLAGKEVLIKLNDHHNYFIGTVDWEQTNDSYGVEVVGITVGDYKYKKINGIVHSLANILDGKLRYITHFSVIDKPK